MSRLEEIEHQIKSLMHEADGLRMATINSRIRTALAPLMTEALAAETDQAFVEVLNKMELAWFEAKYPGARQAQCTQGNGFAGWASNQLLGSGGISS